MRTAWAFLAALNEYAAFSEKMANQTGPPQGILGTALPE